MENTAYELMRPEGWSMIHVFAVRQHFKFDKVLKVIGLTSFSSDSLSLSSEVCGKEPHFRKCNYLQRGHIYDYCAEDKAKQHSPNKRLIIQPTLSSDVDSNDSDDSDDSDDSEG